MRVILNLKEQSVYVSNYYSTTKEGKKYSIRKYLHLIHENSLLTKVENCKPRNIGRDELVYLVKLGGKAS